MSEYRYQRGDVWHAELQGDIGPHPVVLLSRAAAMAARRAAIVALVTTDSRGIRTQVELGADQGLDHDSIIDCDELHTIDTADLLVRRGRLGPDKLEQLDVALHLALGLRH